MTSRLSSFAEAYVSGLELGQCDPTVVTLWHAAQALEIEVHLLKERSQN